MNTDLIKYVIAYIYIILVILLVIIHIWRLSKLLYNYIFASRTNIFETPKAPPKENTPS